MAKNLKLAVLLRSARFPSNAKEVEHDASKGAVMRLLVSGVKSMEPDAPKNPLTLAWDLSRTSLSLKRRRCPCMWKTRALCYVLGSSLQREIAALTSQMGRVGKRNSFLFYLPLFFIFLLWETMSSLHLV